jgi:hypothetical protein
MPLIETDNASPEAFGMGTLAPHADQSKFRSFWACVEGENDGRWPSVREAQEGLRVGNDGRKKLPYTQFERDKGKYHDVAYGKVKLREMIVPIEDAREKDRYEGMLSTRAVNNFAEQMTEKAVAVKGRAELETMPIERHD